MNLLSARADHNIILHMPNNDVQPALAPGYGSGRGTDLFGCSGCPLSVVQGGTEGAGDSMAGPL